jgi:hypothetical protein
VLELDRHLHAASPAGLAARPQPESAQLARQRLIAALEPELAQLAQQHARAHVRVVGEARPEVLAKRLEHAHRRRP